MSYFSFNTFHCGVFIMIITARFKLQSLKVRSYSYSIWKIVFNVANSSRIIKFVNYFGIPVKLIEAE